jgi:hypothetical protein
VTRHRDPGAGWRTFAAVLLTIAGVLNFILGVAAISGSDFFVQGSDYIVNGLHSWGWIIALTGVIQFFTAFAIWGETAWGRWIGTVAAVSNAIVQILFLPAFPLAALAIFGLDILIVYGLVAYGGRRPTIA